MEYNLKEQLFDRIGGLELVNPDEYGAKYNKGVREAKARVVSFFNAELVPEVPQYVANWYEINKFDLEFNIWSYIFNWKDQSDTSFKTWMDYTSNNPIRTLMNMKQFGYRVKEDKKYIVRMKVLEIDESYLKFQLDDKYWYMGIVGEYKHARGKHTKKELEEAGLGGVFDNPLFEVKEVE